MFNKLRGLIEKPFVRDYNPRIGFIVNAMLIEKSNWCPDPDDNRRKMHVEVVDLE